MVYHSIEMNISLKLWSTQHHKYVSSWPVALIHLGRTILLFAHIFDRSSFSQILSYILFLLVNSGFTMPIKLYWNKQNAIKFKIINIRWGTMLCSGRFFRRKSIIFLFWCVNSIVHLNSYLFHAGCIGSYFVLWNVSRWSQIIYLIKFYEFYGHIVINMANLLWMFWK